MSVTYGTRYLRDFESGNPFGTSCISPGFAGAACDVRPAPPPPPTIIHKRYTTAGFEPHYARDPSFYPGISSYCAAPAYGCAPVGCPPPVHHGIGLRAEPLMHHAVPSASCRTDVHSALEEARCAYRDARRTPECYGGHFTGRVGPIGTGGAPHPGEVRPPIAIDVARY